MEFTRQDKIKLLQTLFANHKQGIALPNEYTYSKFYFLVEEKLLDGTISTTAYDKAKLDYQYYLQNIVNTGGVVDSNVAKELILSLQENKLTDKQIAYLKDKAKGIMLKEYFDSIDELIFK
jgi:hypothetical protein